MSRSLIIPWWQEQTLTAEVPLESRLTFYTSNPDLLPKAAAAITGVLFLIAFLKKSRKTLSS